MVGSFQQVIHDREECRARNWLLKEVACTLKQPGMFLHRQIFGGHNNHRDGRQISACLHLRQHLEAAFWHEAVAALRREDHAHLEQLITDEKQELAAALDAFQPTAESFRDNLRAFAISFTELITGENHMSTIRMVVGAVEKFPAVGAMFFRAGAERGTTRLTEVFGTAVADGRLRPCDPTVAAHHFIALCTSEVMKKSLFGAALRPSPEEARRIVDNGLDVFMSYYSRD